MGPAAWIYRQLCIHKYKDVHGMKSKICGPRSAYSFPKDGCILKDAAFHADFPKSIHTSIIWHIFYSRLTYSRRRFKMYLCTII